MQRALDLAQNGLGHVEPNPMVGCVIVKNQRLIGEGYHRSFGGPHAEVEALRSVSESPEESTVYVNLEPCCHQGKTPPCSDALLKAKVARVVIGTTDPNPKVAGQGIEQLEAAGIKVDCNVLGQASQTLNAPFFMLQNSERPWVIAKWAMTLDGKIASHSGDSQWISNELSREVVHQIRGRVDAILVGIGTALADDPLLTARPKGPRTATRIVMDSQCRLLPSSQLAKTANEIPTMVVTSRQADKSKVKTLTDLGCEVWSTESNSPSQQVNELLMELGRRSFTNVLVEGGGTLMGSLLDAQLVNEVHTFISPRILGGNDATSPIAGHGFDKIDLANRLEGVRINQLDNDLYIQGRIQRPV